MEFQFTETPSIPLDKDKTSRPVTDICDLNWIKSKQRESIQYQDEITIVDLFCGCGGMTLGLTEAANRNGYGLKIKLAVDINEAALGVYRRNFNVSGSIAQNTDISKLVSSNIGSPLSSEEKKLQKEYGNIDILVAGPPCQGHSNLNNHTRRSDPRNDLYLNAIRMVEVLRPKVAIIENVSAVVHDEDQVVTTSDYALKASGYSVYSKVINTADYGLAQSRKRHLHIAVLDTKFKLNLSAYSGKKYNLSDYIADIQDEPFTSENADIFYQPSRTQKINVKRINYLFDKDLYDLPDRQRPDCHKKKDHSYTSCYGRLSWDKPAQTITSGFGSVGQGRYIHPSKRRVITPHEAARIQGFPDFFDFTGVGSRVDLHTMIANAVPPKVIAMVADIVLKNQSLIGHE